MTLNSRVWVTLADAAPIAQNISEIHAVENLSPNRRLMTPTKPTPLSAGALVYLCFHRPKAWVQDRYDGFAGRRGEKAMRAAARALPPVVLPNWGLAGPPCRFLTGARFIHQTIFCARSFEWACGTHARVEIFNDGTLSADDTIALKRALPHAAVIDEAATVVRLDRVLPVKHFPTLRGMRASQPLMRKLLDLHAGFTGPSLYLDSDMLFFGPPVALRDWLAAPTRELFMQQHGDALVSDRHQLGSKLGQELLSGVNSGILAIDDGAFDWPALEQAAAQMRETERAHKWAEQTLFAWHLSRRRATPLSRTDYFLCHSRADLDADPPPLRHYVHKSKALYAAREWRLWLDRSRKNHPNAIPVHPSLANPP
jgi:hypothetical protein